MMNDKKAREILTELRLSGHFGSFKDLNEALDRAIKALERQEKILSYIDRLLNQGTGKKKSLEFLKKYILEGENDDG